MLFLDLWSGNAAPFERLIEIHSGPPISYYCFNWIYNLLTFIKDLYEKSYLE